MNNVVNLDKYRAKVVANEIFDTVENSVQDFMYESIKVIQRAGLDPTDSVQDKMIAISMLFRAMVESEFGIENKLAPMLEIMSDEMAGNDE
tara:strand:+ start:1269 stop:1541 length:273 start_codon:yes stop_codon:yes gene_type:complete